jgi:hypothetical protein
MKNQLIYQLRKAGTNLTDAQHEILFPLEDD